MSTAEAALRTHQVQVRKTDGSAAGNVDLDPGTFGIEPNVAVLHQVVTAQLAAARSGTQSTKTRAEVSGGGAKPWRQKGTGRARQGSTRAPHWAGGGVALGPKPRDYRQRTPKKMVALALRSALSDRAAEGRVAVVESWGFEVPKTKEALAALAALGIEGRALIVLSRGDDAAFLSFRNIAEVQVIDVAELNAYDVLCNDWVVFTSANLPGGAAASAGPSVSPPASAPAAAPAAPAPAAEPTPEPAAAPAPGDARQLINEAVGASAPAGSAPAAPSEPAGEEPEPSSGPAGETGAIPDELNEDFFSRGPGRGRGGRRSRGGDAGEEASE